MSLHGDLQKSVDYDLPHIRQSEENYTFLLPRHDVKSSYNVFKCQLLGICNLPQFIWVF